MCSEKWVNFLRWLEKKDSIALQHSTLNCTGSARFPGFGVSHSSRPKKLDFLCLFGALYQLQKFCSPLKHHFCIFRKCSFPQEQNRDVTYMISSFIFRLHQLSFSLCLFILLFNFLYSSTRFIYFFRHFVFLSVFLSLFISLSFPSLFWKQTL